MFNSWIKLYNSRIKHFIHELNYLIREKTLNSRIKLLIRK